MRNGKRKPVLAIPPVVRLVIVSIEPTTIVVTVRVEQVRIAIGTREISSVPPPLEFSQGCILFGIVMPQCLAPSIFVFSVTCTTLSETVIADTLDARIPGSVAESLDRPHIHLLPRTIIHFLFMKKN